jgi:hypothetical protein
MHQSALACSQNQREHEASRFVRLDIKIDVDFSDKRLTHKTLAFVHCGGIPKFFADETSLSQSFFSAACFGQLSSELTD